VVNEGIISVAYLKMWFVLI